MRRTAIIIGASLLAGFAAAALVLNANRPAPVSSGESAETVDPAAYFDASAETEDRIRALEVAVAQERNARLLLEEELQALYAQIDQLDADGELLINEQGIGGTVTPEQVREFRQQQSVNPGASRVDRLIAAGFSPDQAEYVARRESELQMAQMQEMYDARQEGRRPDRSLFDTQGVLRQELGETQYEQYLEANGQPTSVRVGSVLDSSPGQRAGLQPGDEIVAYGGDRVFSYGDLRDATLSTQSGRSVVVDIVRDGIPMQVVIESGPIGISNQGYARSIRR